MLIRRGVLRHTGARAPSAGSAASPTSRPCGTGFLRSGTLHIESAGENGQETLVNIPRADDVQQTLNRLIEADSNRREYPRPASN